MITKCQVQTCGNGSLFDSIKTIKVAIGQNEAFDFENTNLKIKKVTISAASENCLVVSLLFSDDSNSSSEDSCMASMETAIKQIISDINKSMTDSLLIESIESFS